MVLNLLLINKQHMVRGALSIFESKHQVGDIVRIRKDIESGLTYRNENVPDYYLGYLVFCNDDMMLYRGEELVINHIYRDNNGVPYAYGVECESDSVRRNKWTDEMFEEIQEEPIVPGDLDILYECFVNKNTV